MYLDNAASAQKPQAVIDAERAVYEQYYSNIHRGVHQLSMQSTDAYEAARVKVQKFLGAKESREIILLRGTTEAHEPRGPDLRPAHVGPGDEVLITALEHHSNIVPWQMLCEEKQAVLKVAPIDDARRRRHRGLRAAALPEGPGSSPWPTSRTPSAPSTPSGRWPSWPTPTAPSSWWTGPRARPT